METALQLLLDFQQGLLLYSSGSPQTSTVVFVGSTPANLIRQK